ncbi:hypothetical protein BLNAU_18977 [Blattamonas nauphoetae]|uniref:Uncharacterized protein n=1 Tax=Blattamonas nauphoetae TaxID=2049346 RepID=A0ABQ9X2S4_9EUKA|nr:hypothetical protein BLNAU_18977 [Blattamonas nauphoetae]
MLAPSSFNTLPLVRQRLQEPEIPDSFWMTLYERNHSRTIAKLIVATKLVMTSSTLSKKRREHSPSQEVTNMIRVLS